MAFGSWDEQASTWRERPVAEINVTPLVDVMLVLLVIFIITAPLLSSSLNIELPQVAGTSARKSLPSLQITVLADGSVRLQQETLAPAALASRLKAMAQQDKEQEVLIQADRAVPYGTVLSVMGAAQAAGLTKLGFVAQADTPANPAPN